MEMETAFFFPLLELTLRVCAYRGREREERTHLLGAFARYACSEAKDEAREFFLESRENVGARVFVKLILSGSLFLRNC